MKHTAIFLFIILSAILFSGCKSEAQKKIEAYQLQQIEKAKQDSIQAVYDKKIEDHKSLLEAELKMFETYGCSFQETKYAMAANDSIRKGLIQTYTKRAEEDADKNMAALNKGITTYKRKYEQASYPADSSLLLYGIINDNIREFKASLK